MLMAISRQKRIWQHQLHQVAQQVAIVAGKYYQTNHETNLS